MIKRIALSLLVLAVIVPFTACSQKKELKGTVVIFHAGSLTMPLAAMEKEFEKRHPGVDIQREASGSQKAARKISELNKPCDIMASADYKVIDSLLMPKFADWNVRFASNQMVLCYTDKSRFAGEINDKNWFEILQRKGVVWGHSDPNLDPAGYRGLMVIQLAEKYYKKPGLYDLAIANRPKENIRPKAVELVNLLQTGNMDYAWEYLSVAVQHKLKYVKLPDEVNLGNYKNDNIYKNAKVVVSGKKPGTTMDMTGMSITYGITLVKNSPNPDAAAAFLEFMFDPNGGLKILNEQGQPAFIPVRVPSDDMRKKLPARLQKLVEVKE